MSKGQQSHKLKGAVYLVVFVALAVALLYGRSRAEPGITEPIKEIFPTAVAIDSKGGVYHVLDENSQMLGWAAVGRANGYGGPMVLVAGIDTLGQIVGIRVIEQRETPIFWRMARADEFLASFVGIRIDEVEFDDTRVDWETGATISTDALVAGMLESVAEVGGEAFDVTIPSAKRPFEFGLLEMAVLVLFATGFAAQRIGGPRRRQLRWICQVFALVVIGFWKHSPITLAKLATISAGYFPDLYSSLALYLLIAGFLLTSFLFGRNLYCLYVCPFNAAQRIIGLIGGARMKLPTWVVRFAERARNLLVFAALFSAFLAVKPALASYEPFAALFSLTGTTLQWLLLFLVLTMSLSISTPWCNLFCPIRTVERVIQDLRGMLLKPRGAKQ